MRYFSLASSLTQLLRSWPGLPNFFVIVHVCPFGHVFGDVLLQKAVVNRTAVPVFCLHIPTRSHRFGCMSPRKIGVTEVALRDAHQSLMATRMAMEDMVGICEDMDQAGFWSVECWGGATFDACIRFLN